MTDVHRAVLDFWIARHDNGWETSVAQNPDGTLSAWAAPSSTTIGVEYVEDTPEHAYAAALFALKRETGHHEYSEQCSGWGYHEHAVDVSNLEQR